MTNLLGWLHTPCHPGAAAPIWGILVGAPGVVAIFLLLG